MNLTLTLLAENFTIHRLTSNSEIPSQVFAAPFYFIGKTIDELSLVLPQNITIASDKADLNWCALKVEGPLDFSLTGILSNIANILADNKISIFAISTFDTDYILVKEEKVTSAISALKSNGYQVITD